jgi:hypothetical protein
MIISSKTLVKAAVMACAVCQAAFALNAPYLISATALSDSSVSLSWRNNDAGTVGYLIQRKYSTETIYHFVDSVKTATQLTYTDMKNLRPVTLYTYQVIAYSATEVSDTSNSVQATTLALTEIFKAPKISISGWNGDVSNSIQISITDSSNCEIGYRIYREQDFSSSFSVIADTVCSVPKNMGVTIILTDNTVSFNTWYRYKVAAYKGNDSLFSAPCTTFTFHYTPQQPQNIVRFQKLSDFPVTCDSTGWSARAGNSIILKENPSPTGMFSVINVSNPTNPSFAGYIDSTTVRAYTLQTLIPVFLNYGVSNSYMNIKVVDLGDRMLIAKDNIVRMYQVVSNTLVYIDSVKISGTIRLNLLLLNDTLLGIQYGPYHCNTYSLSSSGFSPQLFESYILVYSYTQGMTVSQRRCWRPYIHGFSDQNVFISCDYFEDYRIGSTHYLTRTNTCKVYHISGIANQTTTLNMPYANTYNTGRRLSPTENLCTNGFAITDTAILGIVPFNFLPGDVATELFVVSDIQDPRPHVTDSLNDAIYRDTVRKQNTLQNILLDTANQRVYLVFNNNLSILGYQRVPGTGVAATPKKPLLAKGSISVLPGPVTSSVTIVLPGHTRTADLCFYDLSGRVIDRMPDVRSNAVLWRPKTRSMGCYIVMVKSGSENYTERFILR